MTSNDPLESPHGPPKHDTIGDYEKHCSGCGGKMKLIHGFCPWCGVGNE